MLWRRCEISSQPQSWETISKSATCSLWRRSLPKEACQLRSPRARGVQGSSNCQIRTRPRCGAVEKHPKSITITRYSFGSAQPRDRTVVLFCTNDGHTTCDRSACHAQITFLSLIDSVDVCPKCSGYNKGSTMPFTQVLITLVIKKIPLIIFVA